MDTGFFKWVWRLNALAICFATLALLSLIGWQFTRDFREARFPQPDPNAIALLAPPPVGEARHAHSFGTPQIPDGSRPYAIPLYLQQQNADQGYNEHPNDTLVNYRIVDIAAQTNRWLFPKADRLIIETRQLTFRTKDTVEQMGQFMVVVEDDTDGNGHLSGRDDQTIYLSDARWSTPVKVTGNVRALLAIAPQSTTTADLIFNTKDGTHAVRLSLPDGVILSEQRLTPND